MRLFLTSRHATLLSTGAALCCAQREEVNRLALSAAAELGKSTAPDYRQRPRVLTLAGVF